MATLQTKSNAEKPNIAVVDDEPAVCNSLKFSLELEGFSVRTYGNGSELLNSADLGGIDCLVIDQRMPGMNGLELIEKLRQAGVSTPAVLITGQSSGALRAAAANAHVPVVEKPLFGNTLLDKICEACRSS